MTRSLAQHTIYVEGPDDQKILSIWFPHLQFEALGGKNKVSKQVEQDEGTSYGLLDRDFASDDEVESGRQPGSCLIIMHRHCIENYLLEPTIISGAVKSLPQEFQSPEWLDEHHIRSKVEGWAAELALYAAANSIITGWRDQLVDLGFLKHFHSQPVMARDQVLGMLQSWLGSLPLVNQIEEILDDRFAQVVAEVTDWKGLHCWIDGKDLLGSYLYPQVFESVGLSKSRARDLLIEAGRQHIPEELRALAQQWLA
jgi:hypothetical protein